MENYIVKCRYQYWIYNSEDKKPEIRWTEWFQVFNRFNSKDECDEWVKFNKDLSKKQKLKHEYKIEKS